MARIDTDIHMMDRLTAGGFAKRATARRPMRIALSVLALIFGGCASEKADFQLNELRLAHWEYQFRETVSPDRKEELSAIMTALFGTPDEPRVPGLRGDLASRVLDKSLLRRAAGPIGRDMEGNMRGLYREHCAHCHGMTGDGMGPMATVLYPYPRDFRAGIYKFKSTPKGSKPTDEDLRRLLVRGIPGTAMPSYGALPPDHIDVLVAYVKYLSIRGEVERRLIDYGVGELEPDEPILDLEGWQDEKEAQLSKIYDLVTDVVSLWERADRDVTPVPSLPQSWPSDEHLSRGRTLYFSEDAGCVKCHGRSGKGDGQVNDYDDWTKELQPGNAEALASFLAAGALAPRHIRPRNFRRGIFRGGDDPQDLYRRICNGIDGTPMPAALLKSSSAPPEAKGLTSDDIWCLVAFVRSIRSLPPGDLADQSSFRVVRDVAFAQSLVVAQRREAMGVREGPQGGRRPPSWSLEFGGIAFRALGVPGALTPRACDRTRP